MATWQIRLNQGGTDKFTDINPKPATVGTLPVTTLGGTRLDLAAVKGWKVVYFWSSACPCVRACERWTFLPLAKRYRGRVSFYAVAADGYDLSLPQSEIRSRMASHHVPYPVLLDPGHKAADALGARVTPPTFLLGPNGRVVFSGMPDDSRRYLSQTGKPGVSQTYLSAALSQALAGKPIVHPFVKDEGCIIATSTISYCITKAREGSHCPVINSFDQLRQVDAS